MPGLANARGSDFAVDLTSPINLLLKTFGTAPERAEKKAKDEKEKLRQVDITDQLGLITTPGQKQDVVQKGLIDLARLDPKLSGVVSDVIKSGNKQAKEQLLRENVRIFREMSVLEKIPEQKDRIRMLGTLMRQAQAEGRDTQEFSEMAGLSEGELSLEIMKNKVMSGLLDKVLAEGPQETFSPVFGPNGEIIGQQSSLTDKRIADPTIQKAAEVKPELINPNNLTDDGFLIERLPNGAINKTRVLARREVSDNKKATGQTNIFSNGTIVNALKDGGSQVIAPDGQTVTGDERLNVLKEANENELRIARATAGQKAAGAAAINQSTKAFEKISGVKKSILNIDRAIQAIDEGAKTGAIISKLPSIRAASIRLDQIQGELGLDVIGETTFGALSESELAFAVSTALPKKLKPPALRKWLVEKKLAQNKLSDYLQDVAIFLGTPGNTVAGWLEAQQALQSQKDDQSQATTEAPTNGVPVPEDNAAQIPAPPPGFEVQ